MSVPSTDTSRFREVMQTVMPYAAAPMAAAAAYVPAARGFAVKCDRQIGRASAPQSVYQALRAGVADAPKVGMTVGGQFVAQMVVDKAMQMATGAQPTVGSACASGVAVAVVTSPLLAGLSGMQQGKSYVQAMRNITASQVRNITGREIPFIAMGAVSGPMGKAMQDKFGKGRAVDYTTAAACYAAGAAAGHVFDTRVVHSQQTPPLKVSTAEFRTMTVRSAAVRVPTVVAFGLSYKAVKEAISG